MANKTIGQVHANIETVARLEQDFLENRTATDRIGDAITGSPVP